MKIRGIIFWLVLIFFPNDALQNEEEPHMSKVKPKNTYSTNDLLSATLINDGKRKDFCKHNLKIAILSANLNTCSIDDFACLTMAANDRLGLDAIKSLHQKLDDDANGNVDLSESDDVRICRIVFRCLYINSFHSFYEKNSSIIQVTNVVKRLSTSMTTCTFL